MAGASSQIESDEYSFESYECLITTIYEATGHLIDGRTYVHSSWGYKVIHSASEKIIQQNGGVSADYYSLLVDEDEFWTVLDEITRRWKLRHYSLPFDAALITEIFLQSDSSSSLSAAEIYDSIKDKLYDCIENTHSKSEEYQAYWSAFRIQPHQNVDYRLVESCVQTFLEYFEKTTARTRHVNTVRKLCQL